MPPTPYEFLFFHLREKKLIEKFPMVKINPPPLNGQNTGYAVAEIVYVIGDSTPGCGSEMFVRKLVCRFLKVYKKCQTYAGKTYRVFHLNVPRYYVQFTTDWLSYLMQYDCMIL